jgi:hypothetical protein
VNRSVMSVLMTLVALGLTSCGASHDRFSPVAVVTHAEQKKGANVDSVACIEGSHSDEYSCLVTLAGGREHRVTVAVSSNGRVAVHPEGGASRPAPPLKGFQRVTEHERVGEKGYGERSRNLPDVISTG